MQVTIVSNLTEEILNEIKSSRVLAIDSETTGLDPHTDNLRLVQVCTGQNVYIFDFKKLDIGKLSSFLNEALNTYNIKVLQNAKFDIQFLWSAGIDCTEGVIFDTFIAASLLDNGKGLSASLDSIVERYLNQEVDKTLQVSDWSQDVLSYEQYQYAAKDVEILFPLRDALKTALGSANLLKIAVIEFKCIPAVACMEYYGMFLNIPKWNRLIPIYEHKEAKVRQELLKLLPHIYNQPTYSGNSIPNLNINSSKQLLPRLQKMGLPDPEDEDDELQSTGKTVLKLLDEGDYPVIEVLLDHRNTKKRLNSFILPMEGKINSSTGRIHPSYWQLGAGTGRFSCSNPK